MSDSQLNLESKTETSAAKAQEYIFFWGGDTAQKKCILGGGTPHIVHEGNNWSGDGDTAQH